MGVNAQKTVTSFALIAFVLLGIAFGMQIMTFIFGQLGPSSSGLTAGSNAYNVSLQIQNNTLQAINTYSSQTGTQFTTVAIAITLVILIAVFLLFWQIFVGKGGSKNGIAGGNFS